jgi:hypothetical protein
MKRQSEMQGEGSFANKMRDRLTRGTDAARRMIDRVRELVEQEHAGAARTAPPADAKPEGSAQPPETAVTEEPPVAASKTVKRSAERSASLPVPAPTAAEEDEERVDVAPTFATSTMGTILLQQGHVREALAVFERAVHRDPSDSMAQRGLEQCRAALGLHPAPATEEQLDEAGATLAQDASMTEAEPQELLDRSPPPAHYGRSEARALPVDPSTIVVFWEMTDDALAEAGQTTGGGATRALCVVSIVQGPGGVERVERYVDDIAQTGDYFVSDLPAGATHHAAAGLRRGEQFVPVVHAAPVSTPRGAPSAQLARVRGTVALTPPKDGQLATPPRIVQIEGPPELLEDLVATYGETPLAAAQRTPAEGPLQPALGARPSFDESGGPAALPSSADLVRAPGAGARGDEWTSSGQWPKRMPTS